MNSERSFGDLFYCTECDASLTLEEVETYNNNRCTLHQYLDKPVYVSVPLEIAEYALECIRLDIRMTEQTALMLMSVNGQESRPKSKKHLEDEKKERILKGLIWLAKTA